MRGIPPYLSRFLRHPERNDIVPLACVRDQPLPPGAKMLPLRIDANLCFQGSGCHTGHEASIFLLQICHILGVRPSFGTTL